MYGIGLDIGTTSVCGILVDIESGEVIRSVTEENGGFIPTENPAFREQDPWLLAAKLRDILDRLTDEGSDICAIGITGQMHGITYLNADGEPVSSLKIWQDGRGGLPYKDGHTYASYMSNITGYPLATGYGCVTWFYDTVNGLVPSDAVTFCTVHDLASAFICGNKKPLIHSSDAASLGLYDIKNECFDTEAVEKLGLDTAMLPEVCGGYKINGYYKNIPVAVAIGDNQASFIGSVKELESSGLINVGTGAQISVKAERLPKDTALDIRPLTDGDHIIAGSSLCGGRAYAMLERFFRQIASDVTGQDVPSAYPMMDRIMENAEIPSPLTVDTRFSGTRTEPSIRGSICGIGVDNLNAAALCDGFMRGMASELHGLYLEMKEYVGSEHTYMVASGNGVRYNKALRTRLEQIFGVPTLTPVHREEASYGALLYALTASGVFDTLAEAQKLIKYE